MQGMTHLTSVFTVTTLPVEIESRLPTNPFLLPDPDISTLLMLRISIELLAFPADTIDTYSKADFSSW